MTQYLTPGPGEEGIFGYGSLLSQRSMERTLGYPYTRRPAVCSVSGWHRAWDVFMPDSQVWYDNAGVTLNKIVYLNVSRAFGQSVNGLLYFVPSSALAVFDAREWVYDRVDVSTDLEGVQLPGGCAWMYMAKPEFVIKAAQFPEYGLRQTYLDIVEEGLSTLGPEFRAAYNSSTDPPPPDLIFQDRRRA